MRPKDSWNILAGVARRPAIPPELKHGPFTLEEARQAGLYRLRGKSWRRLAPEVWIWTGLNENPLAKLTAVRRRLPPAAVFSGRTAAWLHGHDVQPCDPIEVTVPPETGISARAGVSLRRAELELAEVVRRKGMPVTSILRTLADIALTRPLIEAVMVADMALHTKQTSLTELQAEAAARATRPGVGRLRQVAELAEPATESPMETRLRLLLVLNGLPRPLAQVDLHDNRGRFLGRADFYYPACRLILEYDGGTHRTSLVEDNRRQNALLNAGFRIRRFTGADVLAAPETVLASVRAALASPSAPAA